MDECINSVEKGIYIYKIYGYYGKPQYAKAYLRNDCEVCDFEHTEVKIDGEVKYKIKMPDIEHYIEGVKVTGIQFGDDGGFERTAGFNMLKWGRSIHSIDATGIDFTNLTSLNKAFDGCLAEEILLPDLDGIDHKAKSMDEMFIRCTKLKKIEIQYMKTDGNMRCMFRFCSNLEHVKIPRIEKGHTLNTVGMFGYCKNLKVVDFISAEDCMISCATGMFSYCKAEKIVIGCKEIRNAETMFYAAEIEDLDLSNTTLIMGDLGAYGVFKLAYIGKVTVSTKSLHYKGKDELNTAVARKSSRLHVGIWKLSDVPSTIEWEDTIRVYKAYKHILCGSHIDIMDVRALEKIICMNSRKGKETDVLKDMGILYKSIITSGYRKSGMNIVNIHENDFDTVISRMRALNMIDNHCIVMNSEYDGGYEHV